MRRWQAIGAADVSRYPEGPDLPMERPKRFALTQRSVDASVDLRRTPQGRHVCFEVNPSPAFSFYERRAGLPIADCIARYLAGEVH